MTNRNRTAAAMQASRFWTAAAWILAAGVVSTAAVARHEIAEEERRAAALAASQHAGVVRPADVTVVSVPDAVTIRRIAVATGDPVVAGQPLLELDQGEALRVVSELRSEIARGAEHVRRIERSLAAEDEAVDRLRTRLADVTAELAVAQHDAALLPRLDVNQPLERAQAAYERAIERERSAAGAASGGTPSARQELEDAQLAVRRAAHDWATATRMVEVRGRVAALEAAHARARADLTAAQEHKTALERESGVRRVRLRLSNQQAALETAHARLADSTIRAPRNGVIATVNVHAGARIGAGAPLVTLASIDPMIVDVEVPPSLAALLRRGTGADVYLDAESHPVSGRVVTIAPLAGPAGTHAVGLAVSNPARALFAGRSVLVRFSVSSSRR